MPRRIGRIAYQTIIHLLAVLGILLIMIVSYYWPVIERLINWCDHYPQSVADCKEK